MINIEHLQKICDWFVLFKQPKLQSALQEGICIVKRGEFLKGDYAHLFALVIFSYSMNVGPTSFVDTENAIADLGIENEFREYTQSWIDYSHKNKTT